MIRRISIVIGPILVVATAMVAAADLPPHRALRILIVSDEVNPHVLPDADLTQPGEISLALLAPDAGLQLDPSPDAVLEIPTDNIEQATALLGAYDVLIYFAHRIPTPGSGGDPLVRQQEFADAVEAFLIDGGGVVAFHHGAYAAVGKETILDLIGATATGVVPWNTVDGQNVINTAPEHFVTCHEVTYSGTTAYGDPGRGVPAGTYELFNNTPDERYPFFDYNPSSAGNVQTLFGSDYNENGTTHLLGFVHRRPEWQGSVVAYQPGEYQPHALDDLAGNNFQILANAIVFVAGALPPDQIVVEVSRGPGPGDVTLEWAGCDGTFAVLRSANPADIGNPAGEIGQTSNNAWVDSNPPGTVLFYRIVRP